MEISIGKSTFGRKGKYIFSFHFDGYPEDVLEVTANNGESNNPKFDTTSLRLKISNGSYQEWTSGLSNGNNEVVKAKLVLIILAFIVNGTDTLNDGTPSLVGVVKVDMNHMYAKLLQGDSSYTPVSFQAVDDADFVVGKSILTFKYNKHEPSIIDPKAFTASPLAMIRAESVVISHNKFNLIGIDKGMNAPLLSKEEGERSKQPVMALKPLTIPAYDSSTNDANTAIYTCTIRFCTGFNESITQLMKSPRFKCRVVVRFVSPEKIAAFEALDRCIKSDDSGKVLTCIEAHDSP